MNKVAIFRNELLPISETFIKEQALSFRAWHPTIIGYRRAANGLSLDDLHTELLPGMNAGRLSLWRTKFAHWKGVPHPPTVNALRSLRVDLVHAHFGTDATDIWPSVNAAGIPLLVTLHGYDINIRSEWWEAGHGGLLRRTYPTRLRAMAAEPRVRFVAVSEAIKDRAIEAGIPERKLTVAYIGVDTKRFASRDIPLSDRPPRILFVGRMVEKKAPLLMIKAFKAVRATIPDASLVMIGDGPLFEDAQQYARKLEVPVVFLGACRPDIVLQHLRGASVLCLPSVVSSNGDAEGLPTVILEALACQTPVVTSARGACGEVIRNDECGLTFQEHDVTQLVAQLLRAMRDKALAHQITMAGKRRVCSQFEITRCTSLLERLYERQIGL